MNDLTPTPPRREWIAVALFTVIALVLRASRLTYFSFWTDECLTIFVCQMSLKQIMQIVLYTDVHPPLYYVLLHLWQMISHNEIFLRSISLIPGVASVPVIYLLGRRLLPARAALIASALMAVNPLSVVQSQQIRYPAMMALLTMLSVLYFHRVLTENRRRDAWIFGIVSLLMLYTNYLGLGALLFEIIWLAVAWRQRPVGRRRTVKTLAAVCALTALWAPIALLQFVRLPHGTLYPPAKLFWYTILDFTYGIGFWGMPRAGSRDAELTLLGLADMPWLFYLSMIPFLVLLFAGIARRRGERWWTFEKVYLAVVLGYVWLICARSNIFQAKYAMPALPAFLLVMSSGIDRVIERWRTLAAVAVAAVYLPLTGYGLTIFYSQDMVYQENYRELAKYLREHKQPGDAVLVYHDIARACLEYYFTEEFDDIFIAPRYEDRDEMDPYAFLEQMNEINRNYDRLWVVYFYEGHRDPRGFARQWFPVQFRESPAVYPGKIRDVLELYVINRPPGEVGDGAGPP